MDKWEREAVRSPRAETKDTPVPTGSAKKSWTMPVIAALILLATCIELGWYFGVERPGRAARSAPSQDHEQASTAPVAPASAPGVPTPVAEPSGSAAVTPGHDFAASNGMEMVWVPPLKAWVGKYPVTQAAYEKVMGTNPSHFKGANNPVEEVSWIDATDYCAKLSQKDAGVLPPNYRYRLPTDAQYSVLLGDAGLQDAVTSLGTASSSTAPVGSKGPNQYGLYDTRGNVWEWCIDWYDARIAALDASPRDPEGGLKYKVMRGGSWSSSGPTALEGTGRGSHTPGRRDDFVGFRCIAVSEAGQ